MMWNDEHFCTNPHWERQKKTIIGSVTPAIGIFLICSALLLTIYKYRVKVFNAFGFHPLDLDECEDEDLYFDVFVSFSQLDRSVGLEVVEYLKAKDCRVCFHEEHFIYGKPIKQNIIAAVKKSKRTLCLVSENFVESHHCMMEFEEALMQNFSLQRERLIVILLHQFEFPQSAAALDHFIKNHTYINWNAATWKENVNYSMPRKRLGCETRTSDDVLISSRDVEIARERGLGNLMVEDEELLDDYFSSNEETHLLFYNSRTTSLKSIAFVP